MDPCAHQDQPRKTQLWNQAGVFPIGCGHIVAAGRAAHPPVTVWRGDPDIPSKKRGVRVLGTHLGDRDFVEAQVLQTSELHAVLLSRISAVPDLQCALLLSVSARANYLLWVVHPSWSPVFATTHHNAVWNCLCGLLETEQAFPCLSGVWASAARPETGTAPSGQVGRTLCQPSANAIPQSRTSFASHSNGEMEGST